MKLYICIIYIVYTYKLETQSVVKINYHTQKKEDQEKILNAVLFAVVCKRQDERVETVIVNKPGIGNEINERRRRVKISIFGSVRQV